MNKGLRLLTTPSGHGDGKAQGDNCHRDEVDDERIVAIDESAHGIIGRAVAAHHTAGLSANPEAVAGGERDACEHENQSITCYHLVT